MLLKFLRTQSYAAQQIKFKYSRDRVSDNIMKFVSEIVNSYILVTSGFLCLNEYLFDVF